MFRLQTDFVFHSVRLSEHGFDNTFREAIPRAKLVVYASFGSTCLVESMGPPRTNTRSIFEPAQHQLVQGVVPDALVFPGEHPDVVTFKNWHEPAVKIVTDKKWMALVRGKIPAEHLKACAERDMTKI